MTLHTSLVKEITGSQVEGKSYLLEMLIPCAGAWSAGRAFGLYLNSCHPSSLYLSLTGCPLYLPHVTCTLELITKLALHKSVSIRLKAAQTVQLTSKVRLYTARLGNTNSFRDLKFPW